MEVIDKGVNPTNPKECILEVQMSNKEWTQISKVLEKEGKTFEEWAVEKLTAAVTQMKAQKDSHNG